MGASTTLLFLALVLFARQAPEANRDPAAVRLVNVLTTAAMGWALAALAVSEALWRRLLLSAPPGALAARARAGFIARAAVREASALFALAAGFVAASGGVLRAYPAYWVNAVPAGLFILFLRARWPSREALEEEVASVLAR